MQAQGSDVRRVLQGARHVRPVDRWAGGPLEDDERRPSDLGFDHEQHPRQRQDGEGREARPLQRPGYAADRESRP